MKPRLPMAPVLLLLAALGLVWPKAPRVLGQPTTDPPAGEASPAGDPAPELGPLLLRAACPTFEMRTVAELAALELERTVLLDGEALEDAVSAPPSAIVRVECGDGGEAAVHVSLEPATSGLAALDWRLDAADVPAAGRSRWLALELAELVGESVRLARRAAAVVDEAVSAAAVGVLGAVVRAEAAEDEEHAVHGPEGLVLTALGEYRLFADAGHALWGGALELEVPLGTRVALVVDGEAATGTEALTLGESRLVLASGGARLALRVPLGRWTVRPTAGWRAGYVWLSATVPSGIAATTSGVSGLWGGPEAEVAVRARLGAWPRLCFGVGAGWTVWSVGGLVAGAREVDVAGPWVGLRLGLGGGW